MRHGAPGPEPRERAPCCGTRGSEASAYRRLSESRGPSAVESTVATRGKAQVF
jgi:hypothetical protein